MIFEATTLATIALHSAAGWLPSGHVWHTTDIPVPYCLSANGTNTNLTTNQQRNAVTAAINSWLASVGLSCTTYNATAQPSAQCSGVLDGGDSQNNIFFENNWTQGSGTIGITWSVFSGNCGNVTNDLNQTYSLGCSDDADIEFNDVHYFWDDQGFDTDVQSIAVHEYGHFIGLDHCSDNNTCQIGSGIMYAAYPGGTIRVPSNDDVEGGCALYPGTPGGLHWPCDNTNDCSSAPICVNPGPSGYCTQTCGSCPTGYRCDTNPQNAAQTVCLVDDGLNRDLCEICQAGFPDACANNGECFSGLPEANVGRCAIPCPNPAAPDGGCPNLYSCYQVTIAGNPEDFCFPRSSDCTDLNNITELQLGQACNGNPACAPGLDCIGICSPPCTGGPGQGTCPSGYACETFNFQSGPESYCAPPVTEGQNCNGIVACTVGPCLLVNNTATCYRDCANNPNACNNAQQCNTYQLQGGGDVSVCEPPGVPPRRDAGIPPDTGAPPDLGCTGPSCDPDGGVVEEDAMVVEPGPDTGVPMPKPDAGNGGTNFCTCDLTYGCDPGCRDCDPECQCACDETFACDEGCEECDPECNERGKGCSGCTSTGQQANNTRDLLALFGLFAGAIVLLGLRRIVR